MTAGRVASFSAIRGVDLKRVRLRIQRRQRARPVRVGGSAPRCDITLRDKTLSSQKGILANRVGRGEQSTLTAISYLNASSASLR